MSGFQLAAIELNNIGVILHQCNQHMDAARYFMDAIHAMKKSIDCGFNGVIFSCSDDKNKIITGLMSQQNKIALLRNFHANTDEMLGKENGLPLSLSEPIKIKHKFDKQDGGNVFDCELMSAIILFNMGLVNYHLNALEESAMYLQLASSALPERMDAMCGALSMCIHCNFGMVQYDSGHTDDAFKILLGTIQLGVNTLGRNNVLVACSLFIMGQIFVAQGNLSDAIIFFQDASSIHHTVLLQRVACACTQQQQMNSAAQAA